MPSSSSCDFCFFLFRFSFGVSATRTKSSERSISQNRLICHNITSLPGFYKTKKALQQGAYLPPAQVISAFSFFVFLLEFLLREQKAAKVQFLRNALYVTIKKFLPGFYQTNRFCDRVIRCLPSSKSSDLCCFFLPFSFRVSSTRTRSSIKRSISKTTEPLDMPPL